MNRFGVGVFTVLAAVAAGCGDDEVVEGAGGSGGADSSSTPTGTGTSAGGGGSGGGAAPDCSGTGTDDPRFSAALTLLGERLEPQGASGGAIAVVKDGQIVALGAVGSKRMEACDPVTAEPSSTSASRASSSPAWRCSTPSRTGSCRSRRRSPPSSPG